MKKLNLALIGNCTIGALVDAKAMINWANFFLKMQPLNLPCRSQNLFTAWPALCYLALQRRNGREAIAHAAQ